MMVGGLLEHVAAADLLVQATNACTIFSTTIICCYLILLVCLRLLHLDGTGGDELRCGSFIYSWLTC